MIIIGLQNYINGDYVPYNSYSPMRQKLNLISCLAYRAMKICYETI